MNYQKIYNDLISRAQAREPLSEYKETHHIVHKCMGGSDDKENLVELVQEQLKSTKKDAEAVIALVFDSISKSSNHYVKQIQA